MPPFPVRSGARKRSDRCQYWVWSRGGELGRTALTKHARTRPGSFLGISRILPQHPTPSRTAPLPLLVRSPPALRGKPAPHSMRGCRRQRGVPTASPQKPKPPDSSAGSRAADCQERAGNDLFSARGCPPSIVGAAAFHFRVRDGNGWSHRATITSSTKIVPRGCATNVPRRPHQQGVRLTSEPWPI